MKKLALIFLFITSILRAQDTVPVIYNGAPIIDKYGKIVYYIEPSTEVSGLLDFDGVDDYVEYSSLPSGMTPGDSDQGILSFSFYIDTADYNIDPPGRRNYLPIIFVDDTLRSYPVYNAITIEVQTDREAYLVATYTDGEDSSDGFVITDYIGVQVDAIVDLNGSGSTTLTLNSNSISRTSGAKLSNSVGLEPNSISIGRSSDGISEYYFAAGIYIWDFNYNSVLSSDCQPSGNTNAAWVDNTGSNNGTVHGSPSIINLP